MLLKKIIADEQQKILMAQAIPVLEELTDIHEEPESKQLFQKVDTAYKTYRKFIDNLSNYILETYPVAQIQDIATLYPKSVLKEDFSWEMGRVIGDILNQIDSQKPAYWKLNTYAPYAWPFKKPIDLILDLSWINFNQATGLPLDFSDPTPRRIYCWIESNTANSIYVITENLDLKPKGSISIVSLPAFKKASPAPIGDSKDYPLYSQKIPVADLPQLIQKLQPKIPTIINILKALQTFHSLMHIPIFRKLFSTYEEKRAFFWWRDEVIEKHHRKSGL